MCTHQCGNLAGEDNMLLLLQWRNICLDLNDSRALQYTGCLVKQGTNFY
jgi:hypothetical protein